MQESETVASSVRRNRIGLRFARDSPNQFCEHSAGNDHEDALTTVGI